MNRLINILINPFFLALVISSIIAYFILPRFSKYKIEHVKTYKTPNSQQYFYDLDNDGFSEWIELGNNYGNSAFPYLMTYTNIGDDHSQKLVNQINWEKPWLSQSKLIIGDCNHDKIKEVFVFATQNDSLFLIGLDPIVSKGVFLDKFISSIEFREGYPDFKIEQGVLFDMNGDNYRDIVFIVNAGFSLSPRAFFIYDIKNNILLRSNHEYAHVGIPFDIINDPKSGPIITANSYAPKNFTKTNTNYFSDTSSWLMVFNKNLEFLFKPIEVSGNRTGVRSVPILEDSVTYIYSYCKKESKNEGGILLKLSTSGKTLCKKEFKLSPYNYFFSIQTSTGLKLYINNYDNGSLITVNRDLSFGKMIKGIKNPYPIKQLDIDNDSQLEIITWDYENEMLNIYRENYKNPVSVNIPMNEGNISNPMLINRCKMKKNLANISVHWGRDTYLFQYTYNPIYILKFPSIIGIFTILALFFYFLFKLQKNNVLKKFEQEKRLTELELLTIKNQIDPHFTFNAINTLSSIFYQEDKKTAHEFLVDFSSLIRSTLNHSEKIAIPLKDEIDFVQNYLKLQQFRYNDKFDFDIKIDKEIDQNTIVPRMIIQTFTENSVKHGLVNKEGKGNLEINIHLVNYSHLPTSSRQMNKQLQIEIIDDGIGRKKSKQVQNYKQISTGKGHEIISQIVEMYNKLNKTKVSFEIIDLNDSSKNCTGTKVIIHI